MRRLFLFMAIVAGINLLSCNNDSKTPAEKMTPTDTSTTPEMTTMQPTVACYAGNKGRDSFYLKIEKFPNVVVGSLTYDFYEKDRNKGDIDGKLNGDTLVADYRFMSEGKESTRQVAFLIKDNTATEGYGPMNEKDGKMVFKNLPEVKFSGIKLKKVPCAVE